MSCTGGITDILGNGNLYPCHIDKEKPKTVGKHTQPIQERFRVVPARFEVNHFDVNLDNYEVSHYCLGNRMAKTKITKAHFDSISVVAIYECPINRTKHVHAIGTRTKEKRSTLIVLSEIKK